MSNILNKLSKQFSCGERLNASDLNSIVSVYNDIIDYLNNQGSSPGTSDTLNWPLKNINSAHLPDNSGTYKIGANMVIASTEDGGWQWLKVNNNTGLQWDDLNGGKGNDNTIIDPTHIPLATNNTVGGIKIGYPVNHQDKKYPVELDSDTKGAYVHVPWTGGDGNVTSINEIPIQNGTPKEGQILKYETRNNVTKWYFADDETTSGSNPGDDQSSSNIDQILTKVWRSLSGDDSLTSYNNNTKILNSHLDLSFFNSAGNESSNPLKDYTWWGRSLEKVGDSLTVSGNLEGNIQYIKFGSGNDALILGLDNGKLKLYKANGDPATFYATGGVSALGIGTSEGGESTGVILGDFLASLNGFSTPLREGYLYYNGQNVEWTESGPGNDGINITGDPPEEPGNYVLLYNILSDGNDGTQTSYTVSSTKYEPLVNSVLKQINTSSVGTIDNFQENDLGKYSLCYEVIKVINDEQEEPNYSGQWTWTKLGSNVELGEILNSISGSNLTLPTSVSNKILYCQITEETPASTDSETGAEIPAKYNYSWQWGDFREAVGLGSILSSIDAQENPESGHVLTLPNGEETDKTLHYVVEETIIPDPDNPEEEKSIYSGHWEFMDTVGLNRLLISLNRFNFEPTITYNQEETRGTSGKLILVAEDVETINNDKHEKNIIWTCEPYISWSNPLRDLNETDLSLEVDYEDEPDEDGIYGKSNENILSYKEIVYKDPVTGKEYSKFIWKKYDFTQNLLDTLAGNGVHTTGYLHKISSNEFKWDEVLNDPLKALNNTDLSLEIYDYEEGNETTYETGKSKKAILVYEQRQYVNSDTHSEYTKFFWKSYELEESLLDILTQGTQTSGYLHKKVNNNTITYEWSNDIQEGIIYNGGNGIRIQGPDGDGKYSISLKLSSDNNGLKLDNSGLGLNLATSDSGLEINNGLKIKLANNSGLEIKDGALKLSSTGANGLQWSDLTGTESREEINDVHIPVAPIITNISGTISQGYGGIRLGYQQNDKNYPVKTDTYGRAYVEVPWTGGNGAVTSVNKADDSSGNPFTISPNTGDVKIGLNDSYKIFTNNEVENLNSTINGKLNASTFGYAEWWGQKLNDNKIGTSDHPANLEHVANIYMANDKHICCRNGANNSDISVLTFNQLNQLAIGYGVRLASMKTDIQGNPIVFATNGGDAADDYRLDVGEFTQEGQFYIKQGAQGIRIGDGVITWEANSNSLKIQKSDGTAGNLYATGGISALGLSSGSNPSIDNLTVNNTLSFNSNFTIKDQLETLENNSTRRNLHFGINTGGVISFGSVSVLNGTLINESGELWMGADIYLQGHRLKLANNNYIYYNTDDRKLYFNNGTNDYEISIKGIND